MNRCDRERLSRVAAEEARPVVDCRAAHPGRAIELQAPPRTAERTRGLGLGLYIVDQIVRGHGGSISVGSTPEETTFAVRLPSGDAESSA
jgi:nitrogen-specific signal transduction histidine kinase